MTVHSIHAGEISFDEALSKLLPSQEKFLGSRAKFADYIGGFGSGKTVALCLSAILTGQQEPGGYSLIGRATVPALRATTRKTFLELFPVEWVADEGRGFKESENRIIAKNGHEYLFTHLDLASPEIKAHLRSLNLSHYYVDEASEIEEAVHYTLAGRLRRQNVTSRTGRYCSNPSGRDWQWRMFFDERRPRKLKDIAEGFLAPSSENIHLPEGYIEDQLAILPTDWAERFIYASFADFSDKVYKDWDHYRHVYDCDKRHDVFGGEFDPPNDWPVIVGIDIGGADPWAILFIAIQPETGNLFVFDEYYKSGILAREIVDEFYLRLGKHKMEGMCYDYENQQAAMEMAYEGLPGTIANKTRMGDNGGIMKVGKYLHPDPREIHPFLKTPGSPKLFIASRCENLIRELPTYAWEKDKAGNLTGRTVDGNDHTCDALRYAVHTFRPEPRALKPKPKWATDPKLDEMSRMYWRDVERNTKDLQQQALRQKVREKSYRRYKPAFSYQTLFRDKIK